MRSVDLITEVRSLDKLQAVILRAKIELAQAKEDRNIQRYNQAQEILIIAQGQAQCIIEAQKESL